jgi:hypothetical protein
MAEPFPASPYLKASSSTRTVDILREASNISYFLDRVIPGLLTGVYAWLELCFTGDKI